MPLSRNLGTLTSWNTLGLSRPVMGLIYRFTPCIYCLCNNSLLKNTGPGANPICCSIGTGFLTRGKRPTTKWTTQFFAVPHLRMSGSKPPVLHAFNGLHTRLNTVCLYWTSDSKLASNCCRRLARRKRNISVTILTELQAVRPSVQC